jgi:hypothetical protein
MNRMIVFAAVIGAFAAVSSAHAQYTPPQMAGYGNQAYSPYVNLLNRNINPAVTYQGIVQPQLQAQANFQQLQNQIDVTRTMPGGIAPPRNTGISDTGSAPARFMQFRQYFNTMSGQNRPNNQTRPTMMSGSYGR